MTSGILLSTSNTYIVDSLLGQGSFGKVLKCIRKKDMKTVAIKVQELHPHNREQVEGEITSLQKMRELDPDKCNIVGLYEAFINNGHLYLVFECLEKDLHHFIADSQFKVLSLMEIRPIVCQLANALNHLSTLGLIHTDLKMDNVMLENHLTVPYRVKLIDFGLTIDVTAAKAGSIVQARSYRAPEIFLGLPFTEAIDMWSLGIMTVNLFIGQDIFPCRNELDILRNIVETLGQPPHYMLCQGLKTEEYFKRDKKNLWRLKTSKERNEMLRVSVLNSLDDLLLVYPMNDTDYTSRSDILMFVDMLKKMLQLDPKTRITPTQLLCHPFISGSHLVSISPTSPYLQFCSEYMRVCQYYLGDDRHGVHQSFGEPTSGPSHPVQSRGLPNVNSPDHIKAAVRSHPTQCHSVNTTSCQPQPEQCCIRKGIKRKFSDVENDLIAKRTRLSQTCVPPAFKRMMPNEEDSGHERKQVHDEESRYKRKRLHEENPDNKRKLPHDKSGHEKKGPHKDDLGQERKTNRESIIIISS